MTRRRRTTLQRAAIFAAHNGTCHLCGGTIDGTRDAWDLDHVIPLALGGEDTDDNLRPAHRKCHRAKGDHTKIAKGKRVAAKHTGARQSRHPLPGGKGSKWKRTIDGRTVKR